MRLLLLVLALASAALAAPPDPVEATFDRAGVAGIPLADLRASWPKMATDAFVVTQGGEALPWSVDKETLLFPVLHAGIVRILPTGGAPSEIKVADLGAQDVPRTRVPLDGERFEKDLVFDRLECARLELMDVTGGPWFWMPVVDGAKVEIPWVDWRKTVKVRVRLQSMRTPGVKHAIELWWDGKKACDAEWEGGEPFTAEFETDVAPPGPRTLEFRTEDKPAPRVIASGPIGDGPTYLDWIEVEGARLAGPTQAAWQGDAKVAVELKDLKGARLDIVFALGKKARILNPGGAIAVDGRVMAAARGSLLHPKNLELRPAAQDPATGVEWLVIAPSSFKGMLAGLIERRKAQGLATGFVSAEAARSWGGGDLPAEEALRRFIRHAATAWPEPKLKFVLLVGDATRGEDSAIPAGHRDAFGAGWTATDGWYARVDDDDLPDLAVGRWPAHTPDEAAALLTKVVRFEDAPTGEWRRRLHLALGTAGFGQGMDNLLKTGGMKLTSDLVPEAFTFHVQSTVELDLPFTWPHDQYNDFLTQCVNEGCLMMAYSGHGWEHGLQSLKWHGKRYPILDNALAQKFDVKNGLPMAFLFACLTGSFDETEDCLCEALVRNPGGPVAAIGSSSISHPYADMIFAKELMTVMFQKKAPTIGQGVLAAKRRALKPAEGDAMRGFIDGMAASSVGGPAAQARYRLDGSLAYNLFGDPATRIPWSRNATLKAAKESRPGAALAVTGSAELADGTAVVTLEPVRLKSLEPLEKIDLESPDASEALKRNWSRMNEGVAVRVEIAMKGGAFEGEVAVPNDLAEGDYLLKVYATDGKADAIGFRHLKIGN
ncbi:MAG: hypothetical protein K8T20_19715 [Planctomycetes bacterium]|nr:hypothetical protein [Planctomycetota bacterium]